MQRRASTQQDGFTIIEVLVALMLAAILFGAFGFTMMSALDRSREGRMRQQATGYAVGRVEAGRDLAWDDLAMESIDPAAPWLTAGGDEISGTLAGLSADETLVTDPDGLVAPKVTEVVGDVTFTIWTYVSEASADLRRMVIQVEWMIEGQPASFQTSTLLSALSAPEVSGGDLLPGSPSSTSSTTTSTSTTSTSTTSTSTTSTTSTTTSTTTTTPPTTTSTSTTTSTTTTTTTTTTTLPNATPEAGFSWSCVELTCTFTDTSTDSDGSVVSWDWSFGDSATSTAQHPTHTYTAGGSFNVVLTVTDDDAATDSIGKLVTAEDPPSGPTAETGITQVSTDEWTPVALAADYGTDLVVVATPNYSSSSAPVVVRVRSAAGSGFEVRLANPSGSGAISAPVHWIAVRKGVYTTAADGVKMEAGTFTSTTTDQKNSRVGQARTYQQSYTGPVVLGQVMTANDPAWSVFWARGSTASNPPSASAFYAGKHVGEDPNQTRADETIGYIVIEAGSGDLSGIPYWAALGADTVMGPTNGPPFRYTFAGPASASVAVASAAALDGGDCGWPILYGAGPVGSSWIDLAFDEDQAGDAERSHTTEQVAYIVFGSGP